MYFEKSINIRLAYRGRDYELECRVEHMLTGKRSASWLYFCDKYGRTGTSQCFSALRFRVKGGKAHGMLTTDGMSVTALSPKGRETTVEQFAVTDADGLTAKEERAIRLLQSVARGYDGEIEVGYSGGKDSDVILHLARRAAIRIRPIYHNTTIDPPGTLAHVRAVGGVETVRPERSFFQLVEQMGMPNRFQRFCCRYLKEWKTLDKSIMGIRKAESTKRDQNYSEPTECRYYGAKTEQNHVEAIYPILDWTDIDVLNYVSRHSLRLHPLYYRADGSIDPKRRLGCMCCPLAYYKKRIQQFRQWPGMVRAYCRAASRYREQHPGVETVGKYANVYEWFFREVFFERQEKWDEYKRGLFTDDTDYRQFLQDYFKVQLPEVE